MIKFLSRGQKAQSLFFFRCFSIIGNIVIHVMALIRNIPDFKLAEMNKFTQKVYFC